MTTYSKPSASVTYPAAQASTTVPVAAGAGKIGSGFVGLMVIAAMAFMI
jgi:hypothetical protein